MSDQDFIRDGIELADGWKINWIDERLVLIDKMPLGWPIYMADDETLLQPVIDALVAQLKRQVDATKWKLHEYPDQTIICNRDDEDYCIHKGDDRNMNSLKCIIDSRVLVLDQTRQVHPAPVESKNFTREEAEAAVKTVMDRDPERYGS